MERRLLLVLGILGALCGLALILALYFQKPPEIKQDRVEAPPATVAPPPDPIPRAKPEGGTLKGRVVSGRTGQGIKGALVQAVSPYLEPAKSPDDIPEWGGQIMRRELRTDEDGNFALAELPPDYYSLWVEKKGFAWTTVPRASFSETHEIKLWPACSVRGQVVYPDGFPAEGVRIEYHVQGTHSEVFSHYKLKDYYRTTDADGTFRYDDLPPGEFTVEVYPTDHRPAPWRYAPPLKAGEDRDLGVMKLDDGFTMNVRVVWRETNEPVPDIEVVVVPLVDPEPRGKIPQHRRTDAQGRARFKGLGAQSVPKPMFKVLANLPSGPVPADEGEIFPPGSEVTIRLRKDGIVKGMVLRPNGEPLDQFAVDLEAVGHITQQLREFGENGKFTVFQVPGGAYKLHIRHGNFVPKEIPIDVAGGKELDVGTIRLEEGAQISGVVRRSNGRELEGVVRVNLGRKVRTAAGHEVWQEVKRAYVQKDGSYAIKGIAPGAYGIEPESIDHPTGTTGMTEIEIRDIGAVQQDLVLYSEGIIDLRFYDLVDGSPRHVVQPPTYLVGTDGRETKWQGIGTRLRPGAYTVYVELPDAQGVPRRYKAKEVEVFERERGGSGADTKDPIEIRLFEVRDGS